MIRPADYGIIAFCTILTALAFYHVYGQPSEPAAYVRIESAETQWIYSLDEDRHLEIPGPLGITEVAVKNQGVRVVSSPCRNKIAMLSGEITRSQQWLINLPNQVFIYIEGGSALHDGDVDDVAF